MITQRFKPVLWVGGAALAAASLYLVSLQVANEHKRLEAINQKIQATQHEIGQLNTEFITRANERQLEKWNSSDLALTTPHAGQFLNSAAELDHVDVAKLDAKTETPTAAMALVTSDAIQSALKAQAQAHVPVQTAAASTRAPMPHAKAEAAPESIRVAHHTAPADAQTRVAANRGILLEQALALATELHSKP